jgi:hypothetical protein
MGTAFSESDARQARYWYEKRLYTWGPATLNTGVTPIFTALNWNAHPDSPDWEAVLTDIWVTQNAGVQLSWTADERSYNQGASQGFTDAAPSNVGRLRVKARAMQLLSLTANNSSGANINNFQINYAIAMRHLALTDRLFLGKVPNAADLAAAKALGGLQKIKDLVAKGTSPVSFKKQMDAIMANQLIGDDPHGGLLHITASATTLGTPFSVIPVSEGVEFVVVRGIAIPGATAITLCNDRDEDQSYLQINGAAFAQTNPDTPWPVWAPAMRTSQFRAAAGATLGGVPLDLWVQKYRFSNVLKVRFGLTAGVPEETIQKVITGLA